MRKVPVEVLRVGMKVGKSVYSADGLKLIAAGTHLTTRHIRRLKYLGVPAVYIDDGLMTDVEVQDIIRDEVRVETTKLVKKTLGSGKNYGTRMVIDDESISQTVEEIVDEIMSHGETVVNMVDIRAFDDYTFAHSVNVCALAVLTGFNLGYPKQRLVRLGMAALLHDIGKTRVPERILNKPGKLTKDEFEEVKKHTVYGYEILMQQRGLDRVVAEVALQHHERHLGNGYPRGLRKNDIHEFARITSIVDVYDALTADRVYRKAFAPHEAYEILAAEGNHSFQFTILKAFLDNVAIYPVGTLIRLNTGEIGGVIEVQRGLTHRPVVRVYFDKKGNVLKEPYELDLRERLNITVVDVIKNEEIGDLLEEVDSVGSL